MQRANIIPCRKQHANIEWTWACKFDVRNCAWAVMWMRLKCIFCTIFECFLFQFWMRFSVFILCTEHIHTTIADTDTINRMAMVTNIRDKNTRINIHKECRLVKINLNMIRLVFWNNLKFRWFFFIKKCMFFFSFDRIIHKTFKLHFLVFWVVGVKIYKANRGETL